MSWFTRNWKKTKAWKIVGWALFLVIFSILARDKAFIWIIGTILTILFISLSLKDPDK